MGRSYAGVLGPVAFLATLVRQGFSAGDPVEIVWAAWLSLVAYAGLGFVAGQLAGSIVDDAVRARLAAEMAARESVSTKQG